MGSRRGVPRGRVNPGAALGVHVWFEVQCILCGQFQTVTGTWSRGQRMRLRVFPCDCRGEDWLEQMKRNWGRKLRGVDNGSSKEEERATGRAPVDDASVRNRG